MQFLQKICCQK